MEVREWLEEYHAPDFMPSIDILYAAGATHIGVVHCDDDKIILDITLPDDPEEALATAMTVANSLQDKVVQVTSRVIRMTTYRSPHTD